MNDRFEQYSLLLLAGGKSSRMGQDKGSLLYEGKTFVDTLLEKGQRAGVTHCYVSGHICDRENVQMVLDEYKDCGPLGGLHAGMKAVQTPYCLVLPVDVPQIPVEVLTNLIEEHRKLVHTDSQTQAFIVKHGDREESLIGIYAAALAEKIEERIQAKKYSVFGFLNDIGYEVLEVAAEDWLLANINTPQAYMHLLEMCMKNGEVI